MTKLEARQDRIERLANRLRHWRTRESLSQMEAARALGRSQSLLSKIETGKISPDFLDVEDMAFLYRQSPYEAVTLSERDKDMLRNYPRKPNSDGPKAVPSRPAEKNSRKRR